MSGVDISREACEAMVKELHFTVADLPTEIGCMVAAALIRALRAALDAAERERDGANALVERMHAQDVMAIQAWQKAHPEKGPMWPSSIRLSAWCMGEVAKLAAERDAADATGYARGVRDAAGVCERRLISRSYGSHADAYEYAMNAILALLPATEKEKNDDQ